MKILTEASGSLVCAFLIKAIQDAGHQAFASDVNPVCAGRWLADGFLQMPHSSDPELWRKTISLIEESKIDLVIPSFDETLFEWADGSHLNNGRSQAQVLLSPPDVVNTFLDKWEAYKFFTANNIPTPLTSLDQEFPLVKPRKGRGGKGVIFPEKPVDMKNHISQQVVAGEEYTVDVLCDNNHKPIYIVPRKRIDIRDGKSTQGIVVQHEVIHNLVQDLCAASRFRGPINIQCFSNSDQEVTVIEVNPRISGGMALSFAATENWVPLMVSMVTSSEELRPKPVKYGLRMARYYAEVFA